MTEERKEPKLRFPGFTGPWEQRKVQDIYKITRGYVLAAPETNENPSDYMPYPVYSSQTKNNGLMGYYKDYLYEDAITWTTDGANAGTVNYRAGKFYCTNVCGVLLSDEGYANKCAAEALNSVAWRWVSHVGNPKLMNNVMGDIPISLPKSIEEQNQISRYFEEIDNLITLHRRKCDEVKALKNAMLQKMFPKEGETIPEIRFPGFTGPWGQRRLGDVFKEYSDKGHPELPALTILQGGGTVLRDESDRKLQYDKANLSNYKKVNTGDFIVHLRSFEGGLEIATNTGVISPAYHTFHGENTDSQFFYSYFRSKKFIDSDLKPHVYGIRDGRSIDIEGMKTIKIPFPPYKEQVKIGDFINSINSAIVLYQRKCDELTEMKKSMLQQMLL